MDWDGVIDKNREALKRILGTLVAMAALPALRAGDDATAKTTLPRHLHRTILALLRPAEAAARRLVILAARDLVVSLPKPRKAKPKPPSIFVRPGSTRSGIVLPYGVRPSDILPNLAKPRPAPSRLALPLLDTLPKWPGSRRTRTTGIPRIWAPGSPEPYRLRDRRPPMPDDLIDGTRITLRLSAIGRALDDLPREARRFARWQARSRARLVRRIGPLRPGRPPGGRRKSSHEVHEVLKDLHYFAFYALEQFQQKCAAVLRPELRKNEETERRDTS